MRPQSCVGLGENIYKLEKFGQGHVPTSKLSEEEEFVIDSGASMQMLSKRDLNSKEINNLQRSRNPSVAMTANGEVQTNEEAQVYVDDLGLFVTVQLIEDAPAVLSLGILCEDQGYSNECGGMMDFTRFQISEMHLGKFSKTQVCAKTANHHALDHRS